ncbi:c-type cytochrome [Myxococcaceae bacterium GXIMD 01537]
MGGVLVLALLASACGGEPEPAADFGARLVQDARLSESEFNAFACSTCHATEAGDTRLYPGHSLRNTAFRERWWGGYETRLLDAVNFCYMNFMRGVTPLTEDDPRGRALYEYLVRISPDRETAALPFTVVKDITEVPRGDVGRGAEVYRSACQDCHGEAHTGAKRLTELAPVLPEVTRDYGSMFPNIAPSLVVIEKVRHGRFFGVGGTMPPYGREALSDEDLGALLAYLEL